MARMIKNYAPRMEDDIHTLQFMGRSYTLHFTQVDDHAESVEESFFAQLGMDFYKLPEHVQAALIEVETASAYQDRQKALQTLTDYEQEVRHGTA